VDGDVAAANRELAACTGQRHGHWKEAGMVTGDRPSDDGWTVVPRRHPARLMNAPAARPGRAAVWRAHRQRLLTAGLLAEPGEAVG
jgi:hypothetical protein